MPPIKKDPDPVRERHRMVRIDEQSYRKLRVMATINDMTLPDLLNDRLQAVIAKEWPDVMKKMAATA